MAEKKKHPVRRGVLIACLILLAALVLLGIWQRNNIKALWLVLNTDQQAIAEKQEQLKETRQQILDKYGIGDVSAVELPGKDDSGLDVQTFLGALGTESGSAASPDASGSSGNSDSEAASDSSDERSQQVIQQCIAALYTLEDQYTAKLNGIVEATKSEYRALPKEEQTRDNKIALVQSKVDELLAAEKQCDSEVELLVQKIQQELDSQGSDSSLVTEIRQAYEDSKATWKAACLTELYS